MKETHILFKSAVINFLRVTADDIGIIIWNKLISNTFSKELPAVVSLAARYEPSEMLDYQNLLLLAVEAFIRLNEFNAAEAYLELSKMKNVQENEYLYYVKERFRWSII